MNRGKAVCKLIKHMERIVAQIEGFEQRTQMMDGGRRSTFRAIECLLLEAGADPNLLPEYPFLDEQCRINFQARNAERTALNAARAV